MDQTPLRRAYSDTREFFAAQIAVGLVVSLIALAFSQPWDPPSGQSTARIVTTWIVLTLGPIGAVTLIVFLWHLIRASDRLAIEKLREETAVLRTEMESRGPIPTPQVTLLITTVVFIDHPAISSTGMEVHVFLTNVGTATLLHSWKASVAVDTVAHEGTHVVGVPPADEVAVHVGDISVATGVTPFRGSRSGEVFFRVPIRNELIQEPLSRYEPVVVAVSVNDEFGSEWHAPATDVNTLRRGGFATFHQGQPRPPLWTPPDAPSL